MKRRALPSLRLAAVAACVGAGLLLASSPALGATVPDGLASNPASPSNVTSPWIFTWNPSTPGDVLNTVTYEGAIVTAGNPDPAPAPIVPGDALPVPDDATAFRVQSVENGVPSGYAVLNIIADRTPPTIAMALSPASPAASGWYNLATGLSIVSTCADTGGSGLLGACPGAVTPVDGVYAAAPGLTVKDLAGNESAVPIRPAFNLDTARPTVNKGVPIAPGTLVASEPTFEWSPGEDTLSGVDRYELVFATSEDYANDGPGGGQVIIRRNHASGPGNFTGTRDPDLRAAELPQLTPLKWWIRTFDNAGNVRNSSARDLTIDPTIPPAPSITGGPNAPTQDTSPTFTWTGDQTNFHWELWVVGAQNPSRQGGGDNVTQTTLPALADGDYVFRVTQITDAGQPSAEASRTFKVDTTPPAAPAILTRPTFPAITAAPTFSWSAEPGAYSRWTIFDAAGSTVYGPIDTPVTTAELPALAEGPYTFQVQQIDAAGNASAVTAEGFTVLAPLAVAPAPSTRSALLAALPKQNALRMRPKAGTILPTLRPVLRWKRGPRGTKLYNLQVFKVTQKKAGAKPKVTKVLSRFPRGLKYRPARKNLQPGTCYVWRVWPYTGTAFTSRPVGVSNFCVASKKVLRKKALKAAALRRARNR